MMLKCEELLGNTTSWKMIKAKHFCQNTLEKRRRERKEYKRKQKMKAKGKEEEKWEEKREERKEKKRKETNTPYVNK